KKKIFSELEKNSPIKDKEEFRISVYDKKKVRPYFQEMIEIIKQEQDRIAKKQAEITKLNQIKTDIENETNLGNLREETDSKFYDRIRNINYWVLSSNIEETNLLKKLRNR